MTSKGGEYVVFYFTGTGNSLYVAKMLDENIISIPQIVNSENLDFSADKIGIVCPIYGHEMPKMVKDFLYKATFHTDYLYVVLTYGKRHANAVELAQNALQKANKQADYIKTLLMVDNFLPVFDMNEEVKLDKKVEQQIEKVKFDIAHKNKTIQTVTLQDREVHNEYLARVNNKAESVWANFLVTDECVGCGICTKVCPVGCIYLENQKAIHTDQNCQACFACIHACPKLAIQLNNIPEKNPTARYRNLHIPLNEIVVSNNQTEN